MRRTSLAVLAVGLLLVPAPASATTMNEECRTVTSGQASALGEAAVLQVLQGLGAPYTMSAVAARQDGAGMAHDANETGHVRVTMNGTDIVRLTLMPARTDVKVTDGPITAGSWTTASLAELDVLNGLVTADLVKAATYATADVRGARTDSGSSTIVGLRVAGAAVARVEPGLEFPVPLAFGSGSYLKVFERAEDSRFPNENGLHWTGDVTVRMVHLYLADADPLALGAQPVEVVVGLSHSRATSPTPYCTILQYANASAYMARVRPDIVFSGDSVVVGEQGTGPLNGFASQELVGVEVPTRAAVLEAQVSATEAVTELDPGVRSNADALARAAGVCLRLNATGDCLVSATVVETESHSMADADGALSWGHTTILDLEVAGIDVCGELGLANPCSPPYNTKIEVAGIRIVLNEREHTSMQPGHTDLAVRAVHLTIPEVGDVYLARSYSEASFLPLPSTP
jgi:hypothetical protein